LISRQRHALTTRGPNPTGKMNNWEGGVRVNAFVSGGFLPAARRGKKEEGLTAVWDWYATFCALAGVDAHDERAQAAGLPPIDSVDLWPLISGDNTTSPRTVIPLGSPPGNFDGTPSIAPITGLIKGQWKILIGNVAQAYWCVPPSEFISLLARALSLSPCRSLSW
jgi:arylsulfatase I/J